jgi:hypothetical protein
VKKRDRAIQLRDLALPIVNSHGQWQETKGGPKLLVFKRDHLIILYRSPSQKLAPLSGDIIRKGMHCGIIPKEIYLTV